MTISTEVKVEPKVPETTTAVQAEVKTIEAAKPSEETQEQINWRKFRQEREKERKEKQESDRRLAEKEKETAALKAAMESLLNKPTPVQSSDESSEKTHEQLIEEKIAQALSAERTRVEHDRLKREEAELPSKLKSAYPDFNDVCSQENLDYLEFHHPDIWAGFEASQGNFKVWSALYRNIKKHVPNTDGKKEQARVEKNLSKPQSMSNPGMTRSGDQAPMDLSDQRKADNWKRMQMAMKGG